MALKMKLDIIMCSNPNQPLRWNFKTEKTGINKIASKSIGWIKSERQNFSFVRSKRSGIVTFFGVRTAEVSLLIDQFALWILYNTTIYRSLPNSNSTILPTQQQHSKELEHGKENSTGVILYFKHYLAFQFRTPFAPILMRLKKFKGNSRGKRVTSSNNFSSRMARIRSGSRLCNIVTSLNLSKGAQTRIKKIDCRKSHALATFANGRARNSAVFGQTNTCFDPHRTLNESSKLSASATGRLNGR